MNRHQRRAEKAQDRKYNECTEAMAQEARKFFAERPGFRPRFNGFPPWLLAKVPAGIPENKVALAAAISDVLAWWPADPETRELLERMDKASKFQGTYMQARVILEVLEKQGIHGASA